MHGSARTPIARVLRQTGYAAGIVLLIGGCLCGGTASAEQGRSARFERGVWVTCFSDKDVLYSVPAVEELIRYCTEQEVHEIYLQVYRANQAYYDSSFLDRARYDEMLRKAGTDPLDLLLERARAAGIRVYAWVNLLSLSQNKKTDIVKRYGESVLTRDQHDRLPLQEEGADALDGYYLRENQIFLEPGDPRVSEYLSKMLRELVTRYPSFSGVHFDYVRYPYAVGFVPASFFNKFGIVYGFGERSVKRFHAQTGINPLTMGDARKPCDRWDAWKRDQVSALVSACARAVKTVSLAYQVSCAVVPYPERAYLVAYQDWPRWLEEGIVDYVVLMNYTTDDQLLKETMASALAHRARGKVYAGIGAFLIGDDREQLTRQYDIVRSSGADGVVFFSYDDMNRTAPLGKKK